MRMLMTIALSTLLGWTAPPQDSKDCYDCHKKAGSHFKDLSHCGTCGAMGGSCCTKLCCDTRAFTCATCGKKARANWPEGGKVVDGVQVSIKPAAKAVKVGEPVELIVRITNTGDAPWARTNHAYSHGGFDVHTFWTANLGNRSISNSSQVTYACPQVTTHTDKTGTLTLAAGTSIVYKVTVTEGTNIKGSPEKTEKVTDEAGEIAIKVTEFALNAESNELKVKVSK